MKIALLTSIALTLLVGCESGNYIETEARQAVHRYTDALLNKDSAALEKIWGDDLIFINGHGQIQVKAQRIAAVKSGENTFQSIQLADVFTKSSGRHVLHFSRAKITATYNGKDASGEYRVQMALSRDGHEWHIHAIQMTPIVP